jgi:L-2-hydroxyglutarate oxidase LhgO
MRAYLREAHEHGAEVAYGVEFVAGEQKAGYLALKLREHGKELADLESRWVINAAGLSCDAVAAGFGIDIDAAGYRLHHNRGHYYSVSSSKSALVSHLVYPMPNKHLVGAGIHITIDRAGQLKLGPDTEYLADGLSPEDWYTFDDSRKEKFFQAVVRYFPKLELTDLHPDQIGVRPKLRGSETTLKDFVITGEAGRGLPSLIDLIGIESPGLTCSAEIGRIVASMITMNKLTP